VRVLVGVGVHAGDRVAPQLGLGVRERVRGHAVGELGGGGERGGLQVVGRHHPVDETDRDGSFESVGDMLFAAVNAARKLRIDPELALRAAADRFRARLEAAEALAQRAGLEWSELDEGQQLDFYAQARLHGA